MHNFVLSFLMLFSSIFFFFSKNEIIEKNFNVLINKEQQLEEKLSITNFYKRIVSDTTKPDFKFKIEKDLNSAIEATKKARGKYLVVCNDYLQNTGSKEDFDDFIKALEKKITQEQKEGHWIKYDALNYYLASAEDQKWLKTNKLDDFQSIAILNGDGIILAVSRFFVKHEKKKLTSTSFFVDIERTDAMYNFNKVKQEQSVTDSFLLEAFYKAAVVDVLVTSEMPTKEVDIPIAFKCINIVLDKKEVSQMWEKLVKSHQRDKKPNILLVETIFREIGGYGFSQNFFYDTRAIDDADLIAIDYLIKHYDGIEKLKKSLSVDLISKHANIDKEILDFLKPSWGPRIDEIDRIENNDRIVAIYKKLIASGHRKLEIYEGYTNYLIRKSRMTNNDIMYLKEFNIFFNENLSTEKENAVAKTEAIFNKYTVKSERNDNKFASFKEHRANVCNTLAWSVVEKPIGASFLKAAISWSEYSLDLSKNNPYYLDTLAQLYYKDGQKEKAIATQTLAVKYLDVNMDGVTATDIKDTLAKMKNGTY